MFFNIAQVEDKGKNKKIKNINELSAFSSSDHRRYVSAYH